MKRLSPVTQLKEGLLLFRRAELEIYSIVIAIKKFVCPNLKFPLHISLTITPADQALDDVAQYLWLAR